MNKLIRFMHFKFHFDVGLYDMYGLEYCHAVPIIDETGCMLSYIMCTWRQLSLLNIH